MKRITITTRRKADKIHTDSLFTPINGRTLDKGRYDMGKYNASLIGREIEVGDHVHAVWSERRKDGHGTYYALFCLTAAN